MPYLRKGELLPVKGYETSIPSQYLKEGYAFPMDMHFIQGELRKRDGKSRLAPPSYNNLPIMHLDVFSMSNLIQRLFAITKKNVLAFNPTTNVLDDVTSWNDLTGGDTDFFTSCTIPELDWFLFTNYVDNIRKIANAGNSSDLGGNPPKVKCIEYMTPYVFIANLNQNGLAIPTKGAWCDTGNPENWTAGGNSNAGSHLFTDDPTEIRGVKKLGEYLFVYKAGMSYRGWLVSTADIFDFIIHSMGKGLYAPRSIVNADSKHFYMGPDDFHMNDAVQVSDIGGPVREFVFNRLNRTQYQTCFAIPVEEFKEIWFFITVANNTTPTEVWKYKYDMGFWYRDTISNVLCAANYKRTSGIRWMDLIGTWLDQTWRWSDETGQADSPFQVFGDTRGIVTKRDPRVFSDDGYAYVGKQETKDYCGIGDGGQIGIEDDQEWYQLDFWASGSEVDVSYSIDEGDTWTYFKTVSLSQSVKKHTVYFDVISPKIRFKFENGNPTGFFKFRSLIPYYVDVGRTESP